MFLKLIFYAVKHKKTVYILPLGLFRQPLLNKEMDISKKTTKQ